jgi:hypothetical protein
VRITLFAVSCAILLPQSKAQLVPLIEKAVVNSTAGTVTIEGSGFATSKKPTVFLGGVQLTVTSFSATTIVASTAAVTTPGSYLLVVNDDVLPGLFEVTLGAVGPQGAMGLQGPIGPAGPAGATGAAGSIGPAGATGSIGPAGATGSIGPAGATGSIGPAGATGSIGPAGATGSIGPAGATGSIGPAGATGSIGPAGATGSIGPAGATGSIGPAGATGSIGPAGATGATGATGPMGLIGNPGPAGGQVWTASVVLPSAIDNGMLVPVGITPTASFATTTFLQDALSVPQSCTASNLHVTTLGTTGGGGALISLENQDILNGQESPTAVLSCQVYGANDGLGEATSCNNTAAVPLNANSLIAFSATNFGTRENYYGATLLVSFTCQ